MTVEFCRASLPLPACGSLDVNRIVPDIPDFFVIPKLDHRTNCVATASYRAIDTKIFM
jgi:hypothetical protein